MYANYRKNNRRQMRLARRLRSQRGQSMVSYALVTAALLGGLFAMSMWILPQLLAGLNGYAKSIYFTVNMPFV